MLNRTLQLGAVLALVMFLPGCIVWEIRDELSAINTNLDGVSSTLDDVNVSLASVDDQLTALEATNQTLVRLDDRLQMLDDTNASLARLDEHLASLRTTISNIDSTIPFLDLGGDDDDAGEPDATADNDD